LRPIDDETRKALDGTRPADYLQVWAWRGGSLVHPEPLEVINYSWGSDAGDTVKVGQKWQLTIADEAGKLGAWTFSDALSVAGTELRIVYRIGGAGALNAGKYRITANEPDEMVEARAVDEYGYIEPDGSLPPHKRWKYTTRAVVRLEAVDVTYGIDLDTFWGPQSPGSDATVFTEIARLSELYCPVVVDKGLIDRSVPTSTVYDGNKLEAIQDLAGRIGARYRMGGDGEMHLYPVNSAPVWRAEPHLSLVTVKRKQAIEGLYNVWVITGREGVQAVVPLTEGPLRYEGPHGRMPYKYSSDMLWSYAQAVEYGTELRDKFVTSLSLELKIETVPRPELQEGDRIEVACPVNSGNLVTLTGMITGIRRSGSPLPGPTEITLQCSYEEVAAAMNRTEWAENLTGQLPPLTWDRLPGTWGTLPELTWDNLGNATT
jgi:hypothetical protein